MVFELKNKVALITGGASGIGIHYAKELLRNGAKAVTLADINSSFGQKALSEIEKEFGLGKAIFIQVDVTSFQQFEDAFKVTIEKFKNIDILINNAGILNDEIWEKEIAINVNGVIHGMLLGMDKYLPKYKQGSEAVIVNISSTAGTGGYGHIPIYCSTKHAVLGMTKSWGVPEFLEETHVRVVAVCPGVTLTPLIFDMPGRNLGGRYEEWLQNKKDEFLSQTPEFLAKEVMDVIKYAENGTMWIVDGGEPAFQYVIPDTNTMKKNVIRRK